MQTHLNRIITSRMSKAMKGRGFIEVPPERYCLDMSYIFTIKIAMISIKYS